MPCGTRRPLFSSMMDTRRTKSSSKLPMAQGVQEVGVDFKMMSKWRGSRRPIKSTRPSFQGFAHRGVVGVRENLQHIFHASVHTMPSSSIRMRISSGNRQHGVGIVQVNGDFVGKVLMLGNGICGAPRCLCTDAGNQEIFLFQAQLCGRCRWSRSDRGREMFSSLFCARTAEA